MNIVGVAVTDSRGDSSAAGVVLEQLRTAGGGCCDAHLLSARQECGGQLVLDRAPLPLATRQYTAGSGLLKKVSSLKFYFLGPSFIKGSVAIRQDIGYEPAPVGRLLLILRSDLLAPVADKHRRQGHNAAVRRG